VLLIFAKHDSFDVEAVAEQLGRKPNLDLHILEASHGFMDRYSACFNNGQAETAKKYIKQFLNDLL
jgi:hypothetical protein